MSFFKIKTFITLLFLAISQQALFSQTLENNEDGLTDSINKYFRIDSVKTLNFINQYILKSKVDNDAKKTFRGFHLLVIYHNEYYNEVKMVEYTDSLFAVAKRNNLKIELLKGYHLKNNNLRGTFGYGDERIFDNIFAAIELAKEIKNEMWECKFNQDISQYYMFTGQLDKALSNYKDNLASLKRLFKTADYKEFKVWGGNLESNYLNIAELYVKLKQLDSAKLYNNYAKSILDTLDSGYHELYKFRNKVNQIEIDLLEDNCKSAENNLNEALAIIPDYFRKSIKAFTKSYYSGMISFNKGNFKDAIRHFEEIDVAYIKEDEKIGLIFYDDLYKALYKSYLQTNNLEKADYYFDKHLVSIESKISSNNDANSNFNKIERDQYNLEVKNLKSEKLKEKRKILIISILSSAIIISLVIIYNQKRRSDNEKLKILLKKISEEEINISEPKIKTLKIKDVEVERILNSLDQLEKKKYFLKVDCTASNMAKEIKTNTTYLSKIINSLYQKTFTAYINDLRIEFVLDRLKNDRLFRRYSIQSIANEIGFRSKESFNSAFKKRTGVLPSTLIRALEQQN